MKLKYNTLAGHAGERHSVRLLSDQGRTPDLHIRGGAGHQGLGPGAAAVSSDMNP